MIRSLNLLTILALAAALAACQSAPRNEGQPKSHRLESRTPGEIGSGQLGSADLTVATDRMVESISQVPEIRQNSDRTVIVMDHIENQTSLRASSYDIFLARIRSSLNQSANRENLVFVETRAKASAIRQREGYTGENQRTTPRYALTGTFYDMPRAGTNYFLLTFQLVDLTSELIVWEGDYEVKL